MCVYVCVCVCACVHTHLPIHIGLCLGSGSGIEHLHYLLEDPWQPILPTDSRTEDDSRKEKEQGAGQGRNGPHAPAQAEEQEEGRAGGRGRHSGVLSFEFLKAVEAESSFETSPMYVLGHEGIYCNGQGEASGWAAERVIKEFPSFDVAATLRDAEAPILLSAEHVHSWMFDGDYRHLTTLKARADKLADM